MEQRMIDSMIKRQRKFYSTEKTTSLQFRLQALTRLERIIKKYEKHLKQALYQDLKKSEVESYMTEIATVYSEIRYMKQYLPLWDKKKKVSSSIAQFPAKSYRIREAYGCVLILSPWNYPFLLSIQPLVASIAAGNCTIIKPSEYAVYTGSLIEKMIREAFQEHYVAVIRGDTRESEYILEQKFDFIFYTGGERVGKIVLEKAAKYMTPVALELGGKSPCIVSETANITLTAKRIVFGKLLNSGQTCVAPDYVLVQESVQERLVLEMKKWIQKMYGTQPLSSKDYPAIISKRHYHRLIQLLQEVLDKEQYEPYLREETLQIAPILIENPPFDSTMMKEEIFGPILPVIKYKTIKEAKQWIKKREKPLALYLFTKDKKEGRKLMKELSFGGGCMNDTIMHLTSHELPFGGIGMSGMGAYHGKYGYELFTHEKGIVERGMWLDPSLRYAPFRLYKKWLLQRFLG